MTGTPIRGRRSSFVVRVAEDREGHVAGIIERVATGSKEAFYDLESIGRVIGRMLREARPGAPAPPRHARSRGVKPASHRETGSEEAI